MAAVLDDACERDLRMVLGRERDEPSIVAILVWNLVFIHAGLEVRGLVANHLRGAGLSAHLDTVEAGLMSGAAGAVDDIGHRVANLGDD